MTLYPFPALGFQVEDLDGEVVLLHPTRNIIIHTNQSGALIWRLCNGQRSVDEVVEVLTAIYPESAEEILQDVPQTIQTLVSCGALIVA